MASLSCAKCKFSGFLFVCFACLVESFPSDLGTSHASFMPFFGCPPCAFSFGGVYLKPAIPPTSCRLQIRKFMSSLGALPFSVCSRLMAFPQWFAQGSVPLSNFPLGFRTILPFNNEQALQQPESTAWGSRLSRGCSVGCQHLLVHRDAQSHPTLPHGWSWGAPQPAHKVGIPCFRIVSSFFLLSNGGCSVV